ncbi:hypothetical protein ACFYVL_25045 [Streptomyces sp. NPDC004111]|uniref:hypothetical protein n=1 Tax=Streptomyces sp. NPDC004111 TaxID=3364690 RepID=UPI0036AE396D
MWQGQQPSGAGEYPQHQPNNPYLQPSHPGLPNQPTQQGPYAAPPGGSGGGGANGGSNGGGSNGGGGGRRTTTVVVAAAAVVVVACAVTVVLVHGGKDDAAKDDKALSTPAATGARSAQPDAAPSTVREKSGDPKPLVPGWKTVVNPKLGVAFDVPPQWERRSTDWVSWAAEKDDPEDKPIVAFAAPGVLKEKWCVPADAPADGSGGAHALASAGSRGERTASSTDEAARNNASQWLYGLYTQPDRSRAKAGPAQPFTTSSGLRGSLVTAASAGVPKRAKCDTDGKVTAFAFPRPDGALASWTFVGAKGVPDEVPDATVRKIAGTVRLVGTAP